MTTKTLCDVCQKEITNNEEYKFSISRQPTSKNEPYFVRWDLCSDCKEDVMNAWNKQNTQKGKRSA